MSAAGIALTIALLALIPAAMSVYFARKAYLIRRGRPARDAQPCMPACCVCWAPAMWRPTADGGMKTLCDDHADS